MSPSRRALVLNATFEPLGIVSPAGRAAGARHQGRAGPRHRAGVPGRAGDRARSRRWSAWSATSRCPYNYRVAVNRRTVFARDGGKCQYCGCVGREPRPRDPPEQGRAPHVGERGGRLPAVQHPQGGPPAPRGRDGPPLDAGGAPAPGPAPAPCAGAPARTGATYLGADVVAGRQLTRLSVRRRTGTARRTEPCQTGPVRTRWAVDERTRAHAGRAPRLVAGGRTVTRPRRTVAVCRPTAPAVVLGSTQRPAVVDAAAAAAAGLDVVRRRSGGGAVLVAPDDPVWVDVWVPAGDPLWTADVTGPSTGWGGLGRGARPARAHGAEVQGPGSRCLHPLVVAGLLRRRGRRRGAPSTGARWSAWPSAGTGTAPGSTAPASLRWDPPPCSRSWPSTPAEREAAAAGLRGGGRRRGRRWPTSTGGRGVPTRRRR